MTYDVLGTGSTGNAVIINDNIMIDCGLPYKSIRSNVRKLKIVLATHAHSDHIKKATVKKLAKDRPSLRFACCDWLVQVLVDCGVNKSRIDVLEIGQLYSYGTFEVSPVKLYHNVPNCGYRIFIGDEKLFYATDTGTLEGIEAKDYDLYMVECNYEDEEIQERIQTKQDAGEYAYEYDVIGNHLSKKQCDEFIINNIGSKGKYVYLHQHINKDDKP